MKTPARKCHLSLASHSERPALPHAFVAIERSDAFQCLQVWYERLAEHLQQILLGSLPCSLSVQTYQKRSRCEPSTPHISRFHVRASFLDRLWRERERVENREWWAQDLATTTLMDKTFHVCQQHIINVFFNCCPFFSPLNASHHVQLTSGFQASQRHPSLCIIESTLHGLWSMKRRHHALRETRQQCQRQGERKCDSQQTAPSPSIELLWLRRYIV